eukprot:gnl/MRDRNA2_/MRDRNA2_15519_c0_seq1.p1 gnl/MRDRNA2_/MRDRNA2_15519_c0~~gnl/MRDRNA2_/MRDRNA2_15519_c0_seq1.p1  ORF type:complete len:135 (+),score=10.77 gnl/MRDRNA2_/MRDRNA2_15519_c0_seq1:3-407(+)
MSPGKTHTHLSPLRDMSMNGSCAGSLCVRPSLLMPHPQPLLITRLQKRSFPQIASSFALQPENALFYTFVCSNAHAASSSLSLGSFAFYKNQHDPIPASWRIPFGVAQCPLPAAFTKLLASLQHDKTSEGQQLS